MGTGICVLIKVTWLAAIWTVTIWMEVSRCQTKCCSYTTAAAQNMSTICLQKKKKKKAYLYNIRNWTLSKSAWIPRAQRILLLNKKIKNNEDTKENPFTQIKDVVTYKYLQFFHLLVIFKRTKNPILSVWGILDVCM